MRIYIHTYALCVCACLLLSGARASTGRRLHEIVVVRVAVDEAARLRNAMRCSGQASAGSWALRMTALRCAALRCRSATAGLRRGIDRSTQSSAQVSQPAANSSQSQAARPRRKAKANERHHGQPSPGNRRTVQRPVASPARP